MSKNHLHEPIAVIGVSALFPGSLDATGFWRDILRGTDLMTDVPPSHWLINDYYDPDPRTPDRTYARRGAFLKDVPFDPVEWGMPPSIVPATDTCQLLALIVAQKVLEDATRGDPKRIPLDRTSVILGVTGAQELMGAMVGRMQRPVWRKALTDMGLPEAQVAEACKRLEAHYVPWQENTFPGLLGNVVAGRIANRLNLGGTNCITDAACASTFAAVSMAVNELRLGDSDVVITGGADTMNDVFMFMCFSKTPALSVSGDCRPFSNEADGTMLGEGLGMVALKRLADAERDGDQIYGVIKGVGTSSDGRGKAVYAPSAEGQSKALNRAYEQAGYGPDSVELVEAHGTGTGAGDAAEFEGLTSVFDSYGRKDRQWCALGSVKSQIGHTKAAAGAAGLFKAVMALNHRVLPPTIKVKTPNPALKLPSSPFYLNTEARPWVHTSAYPRRASVSAFGFGGSNFHLTLEERTGNAMRAPRLRTASEEMVVLCAADGAALAEQARTLAADALANPGLLTFLAYSTQRAYDANAHARLSLVASSEADLAQKLTSAADRISKNAHEGFTLPGGIYYGVGAASGDVAFLFPGQGSQYLGMGRDVANAFDDAIAIWDHAGSVPMGDLPLNEVVYPRPVFTDDDRAQLSARLTRTDWAQPALGAASLSVLAVLKKTGLKARAVGGHSFGEVTALAAAGALSTEDALKVARRRGELMADAARHPGAMTAVVADVATVKSTLQQAGLDLTVANHNSPKEVVVSGGVETIGRFEAELERRGLRFKRLEVATAFHSPIVRGAVGPFGDFLASVPFSTPSVAVYGNTQADAYPKDAKAMRSTLAGQLGESVRFLEMVEAMYAGGCRTFVEVGPGAVLTGLVTRILEGKPHVSVATDRKGRDGVAALHEAFARLCASGVAFSPAALWSEYGTPTDPRTRKKPKFTLPINGSNYGKVYPPNPPKAGAAPSTPAVAAPPPAPAARALPPPPPPRPVPPPPPPRAPAPPVRATVEVIEPPKRNKTALPSAADAPVLASSVRIDPPTGPSFNYDQLRIHASGKISSIFGPQFAAQDVHTVQVRMPEPPLLLADRMTGLEAEPNSMGKGRLWTESDIKDDAWYLHCGRMPVGILIESGQADLMLVSWLGIDLLNQGKRCYRLLGCDITFHDSLPKPGETLTYEIHGDGFANTGNIRLFFFHYDAVANGRPMLSVRQGQAGFFTTEELAASAGVLWNAQDEEVPPGRVDPPQVRCTRSSFSSAQVEAFSQGKTLECFGPGYERAETHTRTPAMSGGKMRFFDHVTEFNPEGGPWKRGYLRAETKVTPQDWFFNGHFKNDPCMPGTLMFEATLQTMAFYMAGMGVTLDNDGYRFEPVTGERVKLICRGQVTPTSKNLVYEVFVREFHDGPIPILYADLLVTVDGLKAFYAKRMGLKMVPDWPLTSMTELIKNHVETKPVAVVDGFPFDYKSLVSCAWGRPSEAFGKFYERFDGTRRVPRLPGPPYHFMTRVVDTQGPMGGMKVGTKVSVEYDVPPDAWYFNENGARVMPYSVLLEVALQPCGWLASFVGSAVEGDTDLAFRNLDGKGRVLNEVHPDSGTITTTSEITNISRAGSMIIESFKVTVMAGDTPIYILTSVFGFFTKDALASQTGLPATPPHKQLIDAKSSFQVDLKKRPARYFQGTAKLADSKLLMIDRVTAFEANGGKKGLGFARSEKDVTPGEWFLKAHFFQDPVQPGSLGLEAMQQLLMFTMLELGMDREAPGSRFQAIEAVPGNGPEHVWKYRGQVVLHNKKVNVTSEIIERGRDDRGPYVRADASLWVDGKRIYEATNIGMRLVPPGR